MKKRKFITPVSMECTQEQYERDLKKPLEELGYECGYVSNEGKYVTTKYSDITNQSGLLNNCFEDNVYNRGKHFIDHYNPELFLALAAMTEGEELIGGEYWMCSLGATSQFTKGKLYKCMENGTDCAFIDDSRDVNGYIERCFYDHFRKATKEELINHFTKDMKKEGIEEFRNIDGYKNYQVSDLGRVKNIKKDTILKQSKNSRGYFHVRLWDNGEGKTFKIHKLVAQTFLNHTPCGMDEVVDHVNGNKEDNRLDNLQLVSCRENLSKDRKNTSSKYTGVHWCNTHKKWKVQMYIDGKRKSLGYYKDEYKAHLAYQEFYDEVFGKDEKSVKEEMLDILNETRSWCQESRIIKLLETFDIKFKE